MFYKHRWKTLLAAAVCLTGSLSAPHAAHAVVFGPPPTTAPSPPTVTADVPTDPQSSASLSGAPLTVTAHVTDPSGAPLTVTLVVDGVPGPPVPVTGDATVPLSYTYPSGTHTVVVTVSDGTTLVSTASYTVTVVTPASTLGAKVTGGGSILVSGGKATYGLVAMVTPRGVTKGNWTYQDHATGHMIKSTQITSVSVWGTHARIFGKAMVDDDADVDFCLDVDDLGEPGNGVDKFQVAVSGCVYFPGGYLAGGTVTDGGNIQVH